MSSESVTSQSQVSGGSMLLEEKEVKEYTGFAKLLSYLTVKGLAEWEVLLFGFALVMGNRCITWNSILIYGFNTVIVNILWSASGYFAICLCMGEMTSALPFSGGIYGFVRAILGPFHGFVVASLEIMYCLTILANKMDNLAPYFPALNVSHANQTPLTELTIYGSIFIICLVGGRPFFSLTTLFGIFSFVMLLAYLIGALKNMGSETVNFTYYATPQPSLTWDTFMLARTGQFQTIQYMPLMAEFLPNPKTQMPRVIMVLLSLCIIMSVFISLAAVSQYPGFMKLATTSVGALKYGWADTFNTTYDVGIWLHVPLIYSTNLALLFCCARQLQAISKSHLLPSFFAMTTPVLNTPWLALTLVVVVSYGMSVFVFEYPDYKADLRNLSNICQFIVFIYCFVAYMVFRRKFSSVKRSLIIPCGDAVAIYGIINSITSIFAVAKYQDVTQYPFWVFLCYLAVMIVFYWSYMVNHQKFSEEEKKLMFKAYLINANRNKRNKVADRQAVIDQKNRERQQQKDAASRASSQSGWKTNSVAPETMFETEQQDYEQGERVRNTVSNDGGSAATNQGETGPAHLSSRSEVIPNTRLSTGSVRQFLMNAKASLASLMAPSRDLDEEDQLAILSSGGVLAPEMQRALQEKFQIEGGDQEANDASFSPAVGGIEDHAVEVAEESRAAEAV